MKNTCPWCREEFLPSRHWQKYCTTDHQQRWHRRERKRAGYAAEVQRAERRNGRGALEGKLVALGLLAPPKPIQIRKFT